MSLYHTVQHFSYGYRAAVWETDRGLNNRCVTLSVEVFDDRRHAVKPSQELLQLVKETRRPSANSGEQHG